MPTHDFQLILAASEATEELAEVLYGSGCDDALLGRRAGVVTLDFAREAPSLREAVDSAVADVGRIAPGVKVLRCNTEKATGPGEAPCP